MLVVLAPIHEDFVLPERFFHLGNHQIGVLPLEFSGQFVSKRLGFRIACLGVEWDVNLQALRAGSLGKRLQSDLIEKAAQPKAYAATLNDTCRLTWIQVK